MRPLPTNIDDPVYDKEQKLSPMDRYFSQFIRDERDLPFVYLSFKILCTVPPIGTGCACMLMHRQTIPDL